MTVNAGAGKTITCDGLCIAYDAAKRAGPAAIARKSETIHGVVKDHTPGDEPVAKVVARFRRRAPPE
ncbi:hypothetical protein [Nonomuraea sp. JJY05]|jgi:hypothetical protein|uniref:hypothetical protein n=1 Tax=Nonomuraea sp. JJY05 TaxID=3350255 RepID=UPI00373EC630